MWRSSLFEEHRKGYTDSLAVRIPGQTVSLGRFTLGPKVWTTYRAADGTMLAPYLSVKGIWDCDPARLIDNETGAASGSDRLRGRPQRAVAVGPVADGEGAYDGIGDSDFEASGGSVTLTIPLQRPARLPPG